MMKNKIITTMSPLSLRRMVLLILNYCLGYLYIYPKLGIMFINFFGIKTTSTVMIMQFVIYAIVIIISIIIAFPLLKESYDTWKQDKTLVFKKNIKLIIGMYIFTFLVSFLVSLFTKTVTSNNQVGVSTSINQFPYLMAFTTMIFAPIVEEILFRGVFYRSFRSRFNWLVASVISCCAFGFIHVYDSILQGMWMDCWYFFVYAVIGFFLCRAYEETDTIYGSMILHFINNSIAFLSIIL